MQTTLTFDPTNKDEATEAHAITSAILASLGGDAPAEKKAPAKKAPAKKAAAKKEAPKEAPKDEEAPEKEEEPTTSVTRDEVRAKLKEYAALEGKDAAINILKDNGAASIGELEESKFEDVIAACDV